MLPNSRFAGTRAVAKRRCSNGSRAYGWYNNWRGPGTYTTRGV